MKLKKWIALLLAISMVFALAACGSNTGGSDEVVAKIDDTEITEGQLDKFLALSAYAAGQDLTEMEKQEEYMTYLKSAMLTNMISYEVMRISLEEEKAEIFPKDYEDQLKTFLKSAKEGAGDFMKEKGIDDELLTYYFNLTYYSTPFNEKATKAVTDQAVKAYYEANKAKYTLSQPEGEVSHILVKEEALANEIYDKLAAGGDFAKLAAEYGTDGTKETGGSLGVLAEGQANYDETFMKAAFTLKSGEYSKPVKTQFGYHLIKMDHRKDAGTLLAYADVESGIRQDLAAAEYNKIIEALLSKHKVEYFGIYKEQMDEAAKAKKTE